MFRASFVDQSHRELAEQLHWFSVTEDDSGTPKKLNLEASATVTDIPTLIDTKHDPNTISMQPIQDVLPTGERYVIYRIAVYVDGFNQLKSSDRKSVAGCYMLPLGPPPEKRRIFAFARILTLAPDGVDENDSLNTILDDLCTSAPVGIHGVDPFDKPLRIFIDPVDLYGDHLVASAMSDVKGHTPDAFCTLCGKRRRKGTSSAKIFGHTSMHFRRMGYARSEERMRAVRASDPFSMSMKPMGIQCSDEASAIKHNSVQLAKKFQHARIVHTTNRGVAVLTPMFNFYLSVTFVPDLS